MSMASEMFLVCLTTTYRYNISEFKTLLQILFMVPTYVFMV